MADLRTVFVTPDDGIPYATMPLGKTYVLKGFSGAEVRQARASLEREAQIRGNGARAWIGLPTAEGWPRLMLVPRKTSTKPDPVRPTAKVTRGRPPGALVRSLAQLGPLEFVVEPRQGRTEQTIRNAASRAGARHGCSFRVERIDDGEAFRITRNAG